MSFGLIPLQAVVCALAKDYKPICNLHEYTHKLLDTTRPIHDSQRIFDAALKRRMRHARDYKNAMKATGYYNSHKSIIEANVKKLQEGSIAGVTQEEGGPEQEETSTSSHG